MCCHARSPIAAGVGMLGLELTLAVADFAHVVRYPPAVFVVLGCQLSRRLHEQLEQRA